MFITHIYNIGIPKHKKHLRLLSSGTKLFITFEFKGVFFLQKERHTIFLWWLFHLHTHHAWHLSKGLGEQAKVNLLLLTAKLNSLTFLKSLPTLRVMTSFTFPGHIPILGFNFNISEWHIRSARAWTPAIMLHLTNPCAKRKVLNLTKPKSKIYKTKSLGYYITN